MAINDTLEPFGDAPEKACANMDYRMFIDKLYALLDCLWGEHWGRLVMKRPNVHEGFKNIEMPIITYVLKEARPGVVGQNGTIERKPRVREQGKYLNENNEEAPYRIEGQVIDADIEFTIYAESNQAAMNLSESFRDVMNQYKGFFTNHGLLNLWFQREYERRGNEQRRDDMATRGIDYLLRFEDVTFIDNVKIREIGLQVENRYEKLKKEGKLPSDQE